MPTQLTILDQMMEYWLDRALHFSIAHKAYKSSPVGRLIQNNAIAEISRVILESEQFRSELLHTFNDPKRLERYFKSMTLHDMLRHMDGIAGDNLFPYLMWKWTRDSRRVFELSAELQEALMAASFDPDLHFADTTFPYQTFALKLHTPLKHPDTGQEYGFIMVHNMPSSTSGNDRGTLMQYGINTQLERYKPITPTDRERYRKLPFTLGMKKVDKALEPVHEMSHAVYGGMSYASATSLAKAESEADKRKLGSSMSRLIIGFMLYWQTLPPGSPSRSDWQGVLQPPTPNPNSISDSALVCTVGAGGLITDEPTKNGTANCDKSDQSQKYELSTHERGSYWRRAPGTGGDPNAPRVVYVRNTTVRADRLRPGELPAGALTRMATGK